MATKTEEKYSYEWISILLRVLAIVLFGASAVAMWIKGAGASASGIQQMFAESGFPHWIVLLYSWAIPYISATLAVWFFTGLRLRSAWFVTGLYMASFGFGLDVIHQWPASSLNFLFVIFAVAGIFFSAPGDWKFGLGRK